MLKQDALNHVFFNRGHRFVDICAGPWKNQRVLGRIRPLRGGQQNVPNRIRKIFFGDYRVAGKAEAKVDKVSQFTNVSGVIVVSEE